MAWGIFISCMTLFGTLVLVLADVATESNPPASSGEMRETRQGTEGEDIGKAA
jgi:hypothetical protein